jgi:hypothetical protein
MKSSKKHFDLQEVFPVPGFYFLKMVKNKRGFEGKIVSDEIN